MRCRRLVWCIAACLCLALAGIASAQEQDPQELFNQAVELTTGREYGKAVEVCLDVIERLPEAERPRVHKLLGYAYKKLNMLPEAWHHLELYLESSGKEDTTSGGWLEEVETQLKQAHVKITLTCNPDGAMLRIPGSQPSIPPVSQPCPATWWLKPGKHQVGATASGHNPRTVEIDVRERGDSGVREIRLAAVVPDKVQAGGKTGPDHGGTTLVSKPVEPERGSRALEWALIGSGLALGVAGGIFHGIGYSKNEDLHDKYLNTEGYSKTANAQAAYDDARSEEVRPKEIAAYVLYGVGGAALLAGIVTWAVRKPGGRGERSSGVAISPMVIPGGGTGALMTLDF